MKQSPSSAPAMTRVCFGRPTKLPKTHLGDCSPAKPAFTTPEPLSITTGWLVMTASKLVVVVIFTCCNFDSLMGFTFVEAKFDEIFAEMN